ncbi:metallophosphoesterase family protein [Microbacterium sp. cx-55]|uniref:purple acid phosphatase family protein n=1 Tax=unclassified Microbacterium TaxID=2609290 RepID=UPI001CC087C0|nr:MULTISPECIES: metallophosphoesterase family protein [unclassified Microbacterium]MBZ4486292.1 metallophosphoesterase family protein [Microbacterium sp. cx-55]MCC4907257.1 metallophosphoesterase family protein [Microbacterium sp. cx-59]UGB33868.1 metallophosphoesterase family protein [Microbacterium sp. cx-55]
MLLLESHQPRRRAAMWLSAAAIAATAVIGASLVPAAAYAAGASYTGIVLGVGADETQRVVSWYSSDDSAQIVQLVPTTAVVGGVFPATGATSFTATGTANIASSGGYNRHAALSGLQENTQYSYRVGSDGAWSQTYSFKTQSFEGDYDFLFLGDPQIGSSGNVAKDGAGWADTLAVATSANPNAELLVSGGDQVETANTETQWDAFLAPDQLRQYPWAATIGNHDVGGKAYEQHFYTPNTDYSSAYYRKGNTATESGGDYWYIYKDVLFIDLNSNSYDNATGGGDAAHVSYVTDVVNKHGGEAKYTVLVFHHSIYSPADHAKDSDNKVRRVDFPTTFSNLGVDLVLQGHDHSYARTYEIKNGAKANPDEQPGQDEVFEGPGGVVYVTANSASGSKYYDITAPDASGTSGAGNGADPLNPGNYWYGSVENQEHVRSYVKVQVKKDALVVEGIRSGTCDAPNAAVELGKVLWCGPNNGTAAAKPIGSIIDQVTIHPDHGDGQEIQVDVPAAAPGEFGWTIDGQNGLVDLGTAVEKDGYFEATGAINPIAVSDTRAAQSPWSLSAVVGEFQDGSKTFPGDNLGWTPRVVTAGAGATAGAAVGSGWDGGKGLAISRVLGSAAQGHDRGSAVLGADLDLKIPDATDKGTYRATLTVTALAG